MATAAWYGLAIAQAFGGTGAGTAPNIDWLSDTISVSLHTSTYTPNQDTHDFFDDATNELATAGGYTAGGQTLTTKALTYTSGTNVIKFDADDASWTSATFTCRYAVIHDRTPGSDATRPLISFVNFTTDQSPSSGTFTIQWHANGINTVTVGAEA